MKELLEHQLASLLDDIKPGRVKEAMQYSLLAPGKRIRPLLLLTVLKAYGVDFHPYLNQAAAIEMIHTYSLIHDDLPCMDNDDLRRGRATCHKKFDEATAVLAGDALLNYAFEILLKCEIEASINVDLAFILASKSGQNGMIYGQQQDIYFENKNPSLEELQDIHLHKTANLLQVPLMMGARIADTASISIWEEVGKYLGFAFQIQDDILDVVGNSTKLGKETGSDDKLNKATYVSIVGLEKSRKYVDQYYRKAIELIYGLKMNHGVMLEMFEDLMKRER